MTKLLPLSNIPSAARAAERAARIHAGGRAEALEAATYRIDVAPGCHGRPAFDPPVVGWVCSHDAAQAVVEQLTRMPDGTSHRRLACAQLA